MRPLYGDGDGVSHPERDTHTGRKTLRTVLEPKKDRKQMENILRDKNSKGGD